MSECQVCGAAAGDLDDRLCDFHWANGEDNAADRQRRRWMRSRGWLPEDEPEPPSTSKALKALMGVEDSDVSSSDMLKSLMGMG